MPEIFLTIERRMGILGIPSSELPGQLLLKNTVRRQLAELFTDLGYRRGAEIGVERGKFSQVLLQWNPELQLYSVDSWELYPGYRERYTEALVANMESEARARLAQYKGRSLIMKKSSMEAVKEFFDESLDFVFIDSNHSFDYVTQDIIEWTKKVRPGGCISGHDYVIAKNTREIIDVIAAVDAYTTCHHIAPWFVIDGAGKENASYFWIKP